MSSLLRHAGLNISEPMAFGLSAALGFVYLPLIKVGGFPLVAYRMPPGAIIKGLQKALGVTMRAIRYRNEEAAMRDLDAHLAAGRVVGLQTSVYWLPYFPPDMRFHFNAHNLIVYGKENGNYLISDPVFEHPVECPAEDLRKARFVRGVFAPKGLLYYPEKLPQALNWRGAAKKAVRKVVFRMTKTPMPFLGIRGVRRLADRVEALSGEDPRYARMFVAQVIRMQEEIGTGGAGFRFMYASFLQEIADISKDLLTTAANEMTRAGDAWRDFAFHGARYCRKDTEVSAGLLAEKLRECANLESNAYLTLERLR